MNRLALAVLATLFATAVSAKTPALTISADGRSLKAAGETFFWLGDTGWLMRSRLDK